MDLANHKKDLSRLLKKIADKAKEDGVISEDEYSILEKVSFDVAEYNLYLEKSTEDNYLDEKEHKKLHELRNKIVFNAMGVASEDGKVTNEEHALVNEIIRILKG